MTIALVNLTSHLLLAVLFPICSWMCFFFSSTNAPVFSFLFTHHNSLLLRGKGCLRLLIFLFSFSAGYTRWGSEKVTNGRTGEMMRSLIFMGPTFYQRLIHMAEDKVKFRNTGPVHPLTRQPVADRKRFGGIKFGEMERDCLLAHGAAANLHERLFTLSDLSQMQVCQTCTRAATVIQRIMPGGKRIRGPYCRFCESAENIVKINVPYGAKLLFQELFSMGICLKFETELC